MVSHRSVRPKDRGPSNILVEFARRAPARYSDGTMPGFALILLCWLAPAASAWMCMDEAVAAYNRDDHGTAAREPRPLAERGDASARLNLGLMYYNGHGVRQD